LQVITSRKDALDKTLAALRERLHQRVTVFVGTSGVGKSTLVNALVPDARQRVGVVSTATGKGLHTTTAAIALPLPDNDGWVVDTPGVRSFGLAHVDRHRLVRCFPVLAPGTDECPSVCDHLEPEVCCLDEYVEAGHAHPERLDSLRRLLVSRSAD
jgi:ribosome biogenesis GTPase